MRSRFIAAAALAAAVALTFSACSSGGSAPTASEGAQDPVVVWHMESVPARVEAWNKLVDKYNATNPAIPVSMQVQEWDQVYTKIAAAAQSDDAPDVLFAIPDFATYVRNLGLGVPVTETVNALDAKHGLLDASTAAYTDQGEVYAVPLYGMVQMLWYNRATFAAAGLEAPKTWNQLLAAAEALTKDGKHGIALPAGKNLASDQVIFSLMITGGAANFFTPDGKVNIDTPQTVAAFQLYKDLLQFSPPDSASFAWAEPQAAFNNGSAAMAIEKGQYLSPWEAESGQPAEDLGCAAIPVKDEGGQPGSIYYSNGAMVLAKDDARQKAASDFLTWLMDDEQYGDFLNAEPGLFLPVTEGGSELASWRSNEIVAKYAGCVDAMLDQSKTGALFGFVDGQYISRIGDISGQNILAQAIQEMHVNGMSATDAAAFAQKAMTEAIS
ncbi:MAG: extracellular solute-binding protein [Propionicimonas sp.]